MLRIFLASLLAAALVFPLNRLVQFRIGTRGLLSTSPFWEEAAKTGAAYLLGSSLLPVHLGFGFIEAITDGVSGRKNHWRDALLSLVAHGIFGWLATIGACLAVGYSFSFTIIHGWHIARFNPVALISGFAVSATFHWLWNRRVISEV